MATRVLNGNLIFLTIMNGVHTRINHFCKARFQLAMWCRRCHLSKCGWKDGRRTDSDHNKLTLSMLCSGELKIGHTKANLKAPPTSRGHLKYLHNL